MANLTITNSTAIGGGNVQQSVSTTYKSLVVAGNSSATSASFGAGGYRRGKLYDILIGTNATPADNYLEFDVTTATLGTTPSGIVNTLISSLSSTFANDPADTTFVSALQINSTGEVGIAALTEKWYIGINQRASYRWVAAPGSEILYPAASSATGTNALALRTRSGAYTNTATATAMIQEQ
jgi:hypothetical protein